MITKSNIILSYSLHALAHSLFFWGEAVSHVEAAQKMECTQSPTKSWLTHHWEQDMSSHFTEHSGCDSTELCREFIIYYLQLSKDMLMKQRRYYCFKEAVWKKLYYAFSHPLLSQCIKHGNKTNSMKKTKQKKLSGPQIMARILQVD